jgi:hypothetical protein
MAACADYTQTKSESQRTRAIVQPQLRQTESSTCGPVAGRSGEGGGSTAYVPSVERQWGQAKDPDGGEVADGPDHDRKLNMPSSRARRLPGWQCSNY